MHRKGKKCENSLLPPVPLHQAPARRDASLKECEEKQADTRPDHGARALRHPSLEPKDVAQGEVQVWLHHTLREIHGAIHGHVHSIRVRSSERCKERECAQ